MLRRILVALRREPHSGVIVCVGLIIAYISLSPTLMLFYGSFLSKPLGVPAAQFKSEVSFGDVLTTPAFRLILPPDRESVRRSLATGRIDGRSARPVMA